MKRKKRRIDSYKKTGKKLVPPLASYPNLNLIDYSLDILPNLLWIEAVRDYYEGKNFIKIIHDFLNLFDDINKGDSGPVSGLVQSFEYVSETGRPIFVHDNQIAIQEVVIKPFFNVLNLYPSCPMNWFVSEFHGELPEFDLDLALRALKRWTNNLIDRIGESSNMARAIVLARYIKAGKLKIHDREQLEELALYPNCKDRQLTESSIRSMTNMVWCDTIQDSKWGFDFWETNGRISMCTENDKDNADTLPESDSWLYELSSKYSEGASQFIEAVRNDYLKYLPEISSFEKTSTISGLLSRTTAFLLDMLTQRSLWVAEIGGIILRCMCETLILSAWLISKDDIELYKKFVLYSLGQADLYGLKIEGYEGYREVFKSLYLGNDPAVDTHVEDKWAAQLRTIELGNWAGVDTRKMAVEGGTKQYYDLIFTLSSADVHSQFASLAKWNMTLCSNPLHNSHLMPAFGQRCVNPFLPLTACVLAKETCDRIFKYLEVEAESVKIIGNLLQDITNDISKDNF
ncbi:MAG: hypothetical protein FVQ82_02925 [Planctomycetes bacterium]|nr:hypothetical protein [Planctomycetota bacterium]